MILLDIDNLNILVLFILAFISFKSYQADHHAIESESQSEISEAEEVKKNVDSEQNHEERPQMRSQSHQNDENASQGQPESENDEIKNHDPSQMINEQVHYPQNYPQLDEIQQGDNHHVQVDENLNVNGENVQEGTSQNKMAEIQKCDEQISNERNGSDESIKNPESQSYPELDDDEDEEDKNQTNIPPEKRKKIHKTGRKVKRQLKNQLEALEELREQIEIQ